MDFDIKDYELDLLNSDGDEDQANVEPTKPSDVHYRSRGADRSPVYAAAGKNRAASLDDDDEQLDSDIEETDGAPRGRHGRPPSQDDEDYISDDNLANLDQ